MLSIEKHFAIGFSRGNVVNLLNEITFPSIKADLVRDWKPVDTGGI